MSKDIFQEWKEAELKESEEAYLRYKKRGIGYPVSGRRFQGSGLRVTGNGQQKSFTIRIAAAILILAIGSGIFIKRDALFGPSDRKIAANYHETLKVLNLYSQSLTESFDKLKEIKLPDNNESEK